MTTSDASDQPIVHTPGPWIVDFDGSKGHIKSIGPNIRGTTPTVCKYDAASNSCAPSFSHEVMAANARLIAAAPELLEACELVSKWMIGRQPGPYSDSAVLELVDRAISKATKVV